MAQHYSSERRAEDPFALPDLEIFYYDAKTDPPLVDSEGCANEESGWYFWYCQPGCLPDGDGTAHGPYASEAEALADARLNQDDDGYDEDGGFI